MMDLNDKLNKLKSNIDIASGQVQKNINARLGGLYFRVMNGTDFDTEKDGNGHYDEQLTFVIRDEDTIELWKGDVQVSSSGGSGKKRAVMYAIDPNGWDFKLYDTYEEETTTHGTTYVITPVYDGNGLLKGGPYIMPGINIKRATTVASFDSNIIMVSDPGLSAFWYPNTDLQAFIEEHRQLGDSYSLLTPVPSEFRHATTNDITVTNRVCYDSFAFHINRTSDSEITNDTVFDWDEYLLFRIFVGCMYTTQLLTYSNSNTPVYISKNWGSGNKQFEFYILPCIHVKRFYGVRPPSGHSQRELIQEGYFYVMSNVIGGNVSSTMLASMGTNFDQMSYFGYGTGLHDNVNVDTANHSLEFGGCGLCTIYGNDVDTYMGTYGGKTVPYFNKNIKPRLGVVLGSAQTYLQSSGPAKTISSDDLPWLLIESSKELNRLGLDYDLATGAALPNWAMDQEGYRYNAFTYDILKRKNERGL